MDYETRTAAFKAHIDAGGMVEASDWMPDEYREAALKFIEMHANSEIMGALPEREWIARAPSLRRKMSLTAKVQDEVGRAFADQLVRGFQPHSQVTQRPTPDHEEAS